MFAQEFDVAHIREVTGLSQARFFRHGNLVGIDIDNASTKVDMRILKLSNLPGKVETVAA